MSDIEDQYEDAFNSLSRVELQKGSHGLEELGLIDLFGTGGENLWLGYYTEEGMQTAFERYGFFDDFKKVGFERVRLELQAHDPDEHMLRFWSESPKIEHEPLLELVVRRGTIRPDLELSDRFPTQFLNVLQIEWLQLQNPQSRFTPDRPPLPGQSFPGLGLGLQVLMLLRQACKRLNLDGLSTVPAYFHNAMFYSEEFLYFDPDVQGLFLAVVRDVLPQSFASIPAASWAFVWKMVAESVDEIDQPFPWFHDVQVAPISDRLIEYFRADAYAADVQKTLSAHEFRVFRDMLESTLDAKGIRPLDLERISTWIGDEV